MNQSKLARDLQKAGASKRQARDLSDVAKQINTVDIPGLSPAAKSRIAYDIGFGYNPYRRAFGYAWKGAAAFAVLMIIVLAQPAKPGSALYSVKRGTDKVKSFLQEAIPFIGDDKDDSNDDTKSSQQSERRSGSSSNLNDDSDNVDDIFDDNGGSSSGSSDDSSGSGSNSGSDSTSGSGSNSGSGSTSGSSGGSGSTSGGSNSNSNSTGGGGTNSNGGGGSGGGHSGGVDDNPTP